MLHRAEQVRAKPAPLGVRGGKSARLDDPGEKRLRQVLGVARRIPAVAHEGVEGIPVSPAKLLKRLSSVRLARLVGFGRHHQTPVRGGKFSGTGRIVHAPIVTRSLRGEKSSGLAAFHLKHMRGVTPPWLYGVLISEMAKWDWAAEVVLGIWDLEEVWRESKVFLRPPV